jgi:predicted RNA-binding Zn-ribbon protein involved in translation (DUF1610 family)
MSNFKYSADLCECGRPKKARSRRCAACASAHPEGQQASMYNTCPSCGGPKTSRAKLCRRCAHPDHLAEELLDKRPWYGVAPDYSKVPEDFARAFAGFFMGEGCVHFGKTATEQACRVDVGVHVADIAVLELAQLYFGGSISRFRNRPLANWRLQGMLPVREFLRLVKRFSEPLKAIKMQDVDIMLDYVDWRLTQPHHLGPDMKAEQYRWLEYLKFVKVRPTS